MKNYILLITLLICSQIGVSQVNAQDISITKDGITDYVVSDCEGIAKDVMYSKAIEWVNLTFKNPSEVLIANLENNLIRLEFSETSTPIKKFVIDIQFRDNRYKFDPISIMFPTVPVPSNDFLATLNKYFKKDGSLKKRTSSTVKSVQNTLNLTNISLKNYINGVIESSEDDW
tara:strand:- start:45 stop:563 length:519 start_codon:yes stop_codon:yes gene_type:complete